MQRFAAMSMSTKWHFQKHAKRWLPCHRDHFTGISTDRLGRGMENINGKGYINGKTTEEGRKEQAAPQISSL